jgi:hypothetical protein
VVNQARRMIEQADHKARYALVVMGVVIIPLRRIGILKTS